jgi:hypothetical protein
MAKAGKSNKNSASRSAVVRSDLPRRTSAEMGDHLSTPLASYSNIILVVGLVTVLATLIIPC